MIHHIVHLSDVHIRTGDSDRSRYDEYIAVFNNTIESIASLPYIQTHQAIIVITGDVFHHKNKLEPCGLELALHLLKGLTSLADVYIIRGNHDYRQDLPNERDMISALMTYNIPNLHYLDKTGLYTHENVTMGLVAIQDTLLYGSTSGISSKLPEFPVPTDTNYHVALFHGSINGSSLQNGVQLPTLHGYPIDWFKHYDAILLGDIHLQQIHRADDIEVKLDNPTHADLSGSFSYSDNQVPWGYPGSLIQQDFGESLYGHGYIVWNLKDKSIHTFHVSNPFGFIKARIADSGEIQVLHRTRYNLSPSYVNSETLMDHDWFPSKLSIQVTGKHSMSASSQINTYFQSKKYEVLKITQQVNEYSNLTFDTIDEKDTDEINKQKIHNINSIDILMEYIQDEINKSQKPFPDVWKDWLKHPERMFVSLNTLPDKLTKKIGDKVDKLRKFSNKYMDDFEKFQSKKVVTGSIHFHLLEWNWILNYKDKNVFNFDNDNHHVTILNAKNGHGKSNFLEVICIALFGEGFPSRHNRNYTSGTICDKKPSGTMANTTFTFTLNGKKYVLKRTIKSTNEKRSLIFHEVILYEVQPSSTNHIIIHQGQTAVGKWIESNIGSVQTYLMSAMLSQNADHDFLSLDKKSQKELLDQILSLDHINSLQVLLNEVNKYYKQIIDLIESYSDGISQHVVHADPEIVSQLENARKEQLLLHSENLELKSKWTICSESSLSAEGDEKAIIKRIADRKHQLSLLCDTPLLELDNELNDLNESKNMLIRELNKYHSYSDLDVSKELVDSYHDTFWNEYSDDSDDHPSTYSLKIIEAEDSVISCHPYYGLSSYSLYEDMDTIVQQKNIEHVQLDCNMKDAMEQIKEFESWDKIQKAQFAEYKLLFDDDSAITNLTQKVNEADTLLASISVEIKKSQKKSSQLKRQYTKAKKERDELLENRPNKPTTTAKWLQEMEQLISKNGSLDEISPIYELLVSSKKHVPELCMNIRSLSSKITDYEQYIQECIDIPFNESCAACKQQTWRTKYDLYQSELVTLRTSLEDYRNKLSTHLVDSIPFSIQHYTEYLATLDTRILSTEKYISSIHHYNKEVTLHTDYSLWNSKYNDVKSLCDTFEKQIQELETNHTCLQNETQRIKMKKQQYEHEIFNIQTKKDDYHRYCKEYNERKAVYESIKCSLTALWYKLLFNYRVSIYMGCKIIREGIQEVTDDIEGVKQKRSEAVKRKQLLDTLHHDTILSDALPHWNKWKQGFEHEQRLLLQIQSLETQVNGKKLGSVADELTSLTALLEQVRTHSSLITYLSDLFGNYRSWLYKTHISKMIHEQVNCVLRIMSYDQPLIIDSEWCDSIDTLSWFIRVDQSRVIIEKASGYQRFISGIALRIAFHQIGFCPIRYDQMFIDEGFTACDSDNLERVPSFLQNMLNCFRSIYLVTHLDDLKSSSTHHIFIDRGVDGLSQIRHGCTISNTDEKTSIVENIPKKRGRPTKSNINVVKV